MSDGKSTGRRARVCVVGNAAVDMTLRVPELPRAGETSLALGTEHDFGGKGANQAIIAARAGAQVALFAAVGEDQDGDRIVAMLERERIDTRNIARLDCATDLSIVTVDARGENTIVTRNDAANRYAPDTSSLDAASREGDWIALQGNLAEDITGTLLRHTHRRGRRTLLNPGPVRFDCRPLLPDVDVLVVNRIEALSLSGHPEPEHAARSLRGEGADDVIVTLGADGVIWCGADDHLDHLRAPSVTAIDTVGAGDALCGTLVAGLAQGFGIREVLPAAMAVAAFVVAHRGTLASFPDRAHMRALAGFLTTQRQVHS